MKKKIIIALSIFLVLVGLLYSSKSSLNSYADEKLPPIESVRDL